MVGDDRVRHCAECNLNVYNFAEISGAEVEELIANREGRLCARFYQRRDGTILTKDCPVGFQMKVRRISRVAGAALVAIMGVGGAAAQTTTPKVPSIAADRKQTESELILELFDPSNALVAGAHVQILDQSGVERAKGTTNQAGKFRTNLAPGIYKLSIESPGFINPRHAIEIKPNEAVEVHVVLNLATMGVVVEVHSLSAEPETLGVPSKIETTTFASKAQATPEKKH